MELIRELKKQKNANSISEFRKLDAVKAGKYKMSVQGSEGHYCSPRKTLNPMDYSEMELALFNKKGWLHITKSNVMKSFPRYRELLERSDGVNSNYPVFGYVPVDLLNDLYLFLNQKSKS